LSALLVGYGTLLHKGSLGRTIGRGQAGEKPMTPVIVRGYKRLFNLRPTHYENSHKLGGKPIENAAMNVEPCENGRLNGLAFPVTDEELESLDERERYYHREQTTVYAFDTHERIGRAHLYISEPDALWIERDISKLMPLWRDIVWARNGSYGISESFGRVYDETTYLADGETPMIEVYRDLLKDTSDVDMPS